MLRIDTDVDDLLQRQDRFFFREIPFALSQAMNDTIFEVRRNNIEVTYPAAFTVRNSRAPRVLWNVDRAMVRGYRSTGEMSAGLMQVKDRDWTVRHATGGTKDGRGHSVAIPVEARRTSTGRIRKNHKPTPVRNKKRAFIIERSGKRLVMERTRDGDAKLWYVMQPSVQIDKRFRFYEDGLAVIDRTFAGFFRGRMAALSR